MAQSRPLLRLFSTFSDSDKNLSFNFININWKSVHGVLGIRTRDRRMGGMDKIIELGMAAVYLI